MSNQPIIQKTETSISFPEFSEVNHKLNSRKQKCGCSFPKVLLAMILTIIVFGVGSLAYLVSELKAYHDKDQQTLRALSANYSSTRQKLATLEKILEEQLSETDDPITANQKIVRKMRSLSKCHPVNDKCEYSENIAFFYTSSKVLESSLDFTHIRKPYWLSSACTNTSVNKHTGQLWCATEHPRDHTLYNRFNLLKDQSANPDRIPWKYLKQSEIMMEPGANWLNLANHKYYGLNDGTEIKIKKSGIYMLFASVTFNIYHGATVNYVIRKNRSLFKRCNLKPEVPDNSEQKESCLVFMVAYFNKGEYLTMTIASGTNFILGETNMYIGLYHLTSVNIAVK